MKSQNECAGIVTVTLYFHSSRHISQIKQSIEILKNIGIQKVFVVKDIKTNIPSEILIQKNVVEVIPVDVFETCQKWYIGLKRAFEEGFQRGFIFPCDLEQYEGEDLLTSIPHKKILTSKLKEMLSATSEIIIGDYNVPNPNRNPKHQLSKYGALKLLEEFFPDDYRKIESLNISFPRSEFFIISRNLFFDFINDKNSKWMPWEATLTLLIYASRNNRNISRYYLGEIGDTDIRRNKYEIINQLLRIQYTLAHEYIKYYGYQNSLGEVSNSWLSKIKSSFNSVLTYLTENFVVTIDGPAAVGKSTSAQLIANKLGLLYIDGGIFFRALTLKAIQNKIDLENELMLVDLIRKTKIQLDQKRIDNLLKFQVFLDGQDVTSQIQTPTIDSNVSLVSKHYTVRKERKAWVKNLAKKYNVIAEGRTLGKEIFPDANVKFYLYASLDQRILRRQSQLWEKGFELSYEDIKKAILERDMKDREGNRLERQPDTIYLDTSKLTVDEVVNILIENIQPAFSYWESNH